MKLRAIFLSIVLLLVGFAGFLNLPNFVGKMSVLAQATDCTGAGGGCQCFQECLNAHDQSWIHVSIECNSFPGCPDPADAAICCRPSSQSSDPTGGCQIGAINTAIGCIPFSETRPLMEFILGWGVGIGGGIALLLIAASAFQIMTSAGDPRRLQAGQELLTSAITGLIMIIFSVFILKLIGVNILRIPGIQ